MAAEKHGYAVIATKACLARYPYALDVQKIERAFGEADG